jgi:arginyl-tRNA synthetase|tara:strand:+ start:8560 stop:10353 length:1794 start_codon:yes stop_codon:yes gene_type:complete
MNIVKDLKLEIQSTLKKAFNYHCLLENITIEETIKNYDGFYTFIIFPHISKIKKKPEDIGILIGENLKLNSDIISGFNVVKGFLNFELSNSYLLSVFDHIKNHKSWGFKKKNGNDVMIEFSSPNTNKPLHLGHMRNIFLGYSLSKILEANGYTVHKVQIINDRGIHICKSMVAWKLFGNNETPHSSGIKGDKFVGKFYVMFENEHKKQVSKLVDNGLSIDEANLSTKIMRMAKEVLLKWENKDKKIISLWKKMNGWVYDGFNKTYDLIEVDFDKNYYESETYLLGKKQIKKGLKDKIFYKEKDNSVWVDLTDEGYDKKILLRNDGTSVYITQDIGTAIKRFEDFPSIIKQIYTVGSEQDYHFKVLFKILEKLNYKWAKECFHLSYGMIDLPTGKMKSREGTVVDADQLIFDMIETAKKRTNDLGKIDDFDVDDSKALYNVIALGALKYFLLKVDPKKRMLFDPEESIDFHGNTGPFIQYTYARIFSIIKRADILKLDYNNFNSSKILKTTSSQKKLINHIYQFSDAIDISSDSYSPSVIAKYVYELAKNYNSFYQDDKIFDGKNNETTLFKISLSKMVLKTIKNALLLLNIRVPNKM